MAGKKRKKPAARSVIAGPSRKQLEAKLRRQNAKVSAGRRMRKPSRPAQPIVYTQPKVFNRNRMLLKLLIVASVVLALVLGMSIFFKVEVIQVSGAKAYSEHTVWEASGIKKGDNLLTFSKARASGQIQAKLPYVDSVRIGIKLPNTVNIYIEELEVAYAVECSDGLWWLITSEGRVVEQIGSGTAETYTKILGVRLYKPVVNEMAASVEEAPPVAEPSDSTESTDATGETQPAVVTGAQRFSAALSILKSMELNDIVGEAASVDVTNLGAVELWYGQRYQVNLGNIYDGNYALDYKIACMKTAVAQMGEYETGILDVSFTTWEDQVVFTPFSD
jgi:cell division protein FtsQ